jgi:hypothetical protein
MVNISLTFLESEANIDGSVSFKFSDTAHTYADSTNPTREFKVFPVDSSVESLTDAMNLAKEDAMDYFTKEAIKIEKCDTITANLATLSVTNPVFTGDASTYTKTQKVGK